MFQAVSKQSSSLRLRAAGVPVPNSPSTASLIVGALQKRIATDEAHSQALEGPAKAAISQGLQLAHDSDSAASGAPPAGPFQRLKLICDHTGARVRALFAAGPLPLATLLEDIQKHLMKPQFSVAELTCAPTCGSRLLDDDCDRFCITCCDELLIWMKTLVFVSWDRLSSVVLPRQELKSVHWQIMNKIDSGKGRLCGQAEIVPAVAGR